MGSTLAHITGGQINPEPTDVSASERVTEESKHLFIPLVILAFFLVMLEAFIRELGFSSLYKRVKPSSVASYQRTRGIYDGRDIVNR